MKIMMISSLSLLFLHSLILSMEFKNFSPEIQKDHLESLMKKSDYKYHLTQIEKELTKTNQALERERLKKEAKKNEAHRMIDQTYEKERFEEEARRIQEEFMQTELYKSMTIQDFGSAITTEDKQIIEDYVTAAQNYHQKRSRNQLPVYDKHPDEHQMPTLVAAMSARQNTSPTAQPKIHIFR